MVATRRSVVSINAASIPRPLALLLRPIALGIIVGFVGRMVFMSFFRLPLTRTFDKLLGAAANGALAFVIVYVVLLGLVVAGTVLDPLTRARSIQPGQVPARQMLLAENPQAAGFVPSSELGQRATVAAAHPLPLA